MVRSKVDIPNPFHNSSYEPIFLLSTEPTTVIKKNELNKRISEIEKNLEAVESLINDGRSVIVDDDNKSYNDEARYRIEHLKSRLLLQKSLSDIKSEIEAGKLRRSASMMSEKHSRFSLDHGDYSLANYGSNMSESDLYSLPMFKYEYTQKDQELKKNINALRDRLIRKRISDTALLLKAYPLISSKPSLISRQEPDHEINTKKRLSIIEDSYERLTSGDKKPYDYHNGSNGNAKRSLLYGYLRYLQYTNKLSNTLPKEVALESDTLSNRKVLHMVKSIESMNGNTTGALPSPVFANSKLVDKEKMQKLTDLRRASEKRVDVLRKRLTRENLKSDEAVSESIKEDGGFEDEYSIGRKSSFSRLPDDIEFERHQNDVKNRIQDLKRTMVNGKSERNTSQALDNVFISNRSLSRTGQYLKQLAAKEDEGEVEGEIDSVKPKEEKAEKEIVHDKPKVVENDQEARLPQLKIVEQVIIVKQDRPELSKIEVEPEKVLAEFAAPEETNIPTEKGQADNKGGLQAKYTAASITGQNYVVPTTPLDDRLPLQVSSPSATSVLHEEYAVTKPDLESISQNLTYRRSAFDDETKKIQAEQEVAEREMQQNSKLPQGVSANDALAVDNKNTLGRNISVKGYKSHGKAHSISSNISVRELEKKAPQLETIRNSTAFSRDSTSLNDQPDYTAPDLSMEDNESQELDYFNKDGTILNDAKRSKLRHKLSKRRSFNVLKQSVVESTYVGNPRARASSNPNANIKHSIHLKKKKPGFFKRLVSIFRKKT